MFSSSLPQIHVMLIAQHLALMAQYLALETGI